MRKPRASVHDVVVRSIVVACGPNAIDIVLNDGADGLHSIRARSGGTIVRDPSEADYPKCRKWRREPQRPTTNCPARYRSRPHAHGAVHPGNASAGILPPEIKVEVDIAMGKRLRISTEETLETNGPSPALIAAVCCGTCRQTGR